MVAKMVRAVLAVVFLPSLACGRSPQPAPAGDDGPPGNLDSGWTGGASTGGSGPTGGTGGAGVGTGGAGVPDASVTGAPDGPGADQGGRDSTLAARCEQPLVLDRACTTAADCVIVPHLTNCCGTELAQGISKTARPAYDAAEAACRATLPPPCPCPVQPTLTDDGSQAPRREEIAVTCAAGKCTTYRTGCGGPCATGTSCFNCSEVARVAYYCSVGCTTNAGCGSAPYPVCALSVRPSFCGPPSCGTK